MIAKKYRFHGYGSLKFVYSKGRVARSKYLAIKFHSNPRRENSRLAVVVSKKVTKKAPARNRIRRRIYESMRVKWNLINHTPANDMIITVFDERIGTIPSKELDLIIDELLTSARLKNQT